MTDSSFRGSAVARWREMIVKEHEQSDRRRDLSVQDQWVPFASRFRPGGEAAGGEDPQFAAIASYVEPHHTVLDVGAGGGRLAVPLAGRSKKVIAVEPSESMASILRDAAEQAGVQDKTEVIPVGWEDAETDAADVVLCAHVMYTIEDVVPFVEKLANHARERVIVVLFSDPPIASARPFWEYVHEEERLQLPALPEFVQVLWEMGILPDVQMLASRRGGRFESRESARENFLARLYIRPGSVEEERLERAMDQLLEEDPGSGSVWVRDLRAQRPGLITWKPGA